MNYCLTILFTSFLGLFSPPQSTNLNSPFKLNWGKKTKKIEEIKNFRYYFGDPHFGTVVYLGTKDLDGFSTELHLEYSSSRLSKASFILGPAGINQINCIKRYKGVVKLLNKKYSHFVFQREIQDPLIEDLIYSRTCYPISLKLIEYVTVWKTPQFRIEAWLFGDDEDVFIEIDYIYLSLKDHNSDPGTQELLQSL